MQDDDVLRLSEYFTRAAWKC